MTSDNGISPHLPAGPKKDYSLKEGETFTISIPGKKAKLTNDFSAENLLGSTGSATYLDKSTVDGDIVPLLPPPPGPGRR